MPPPASAWMPIGELSRHTGVSPDLLRAWERRYTLLTPRRTAGNKRLYSTVDEARVRLMQTHLRAGMPAAQAAEMALAASFSIVTGRRGDIPAREAAEAGAKIGQALQSFDESAAEHALQALLGEYTASAAIRQVLLPYMHEVGERWAARELSVAQEHFATNFVHFRLLSLARGWDRGLGPHALLACAPEDQHTLALIAFGIAMHKLGWRITYLGGQTPIETLACAATDTHPSLIVVSGQLAGCLGAHVQELRGLARRWRLAIAGSAASAPLAGSCGAEHLDGDPFGAALALVTGRVADPVPSGATA